jgi:hypothetical protein
MKLKENIGCNPFISFDSEGQIAEWGDISPGEFSPVVS